MSVNKQTAAPASAAYLDCAATTPVDPRVAALVLGLFTDSFGNAGSRTHAYGSEALRRINIAREQVATSLEAGADEIVFTSGATESNNLAILGLAPWGRAEERRHIVSTAIEHKAVLEPLEHLVAAAGFEVTLVQPDIHGHVAAEAVLAAVRPDTLLVSLMHANNETGALQPVSQVADGLSAMGGPFFHVDAAQTYGKDDAVLAHPRIDLVSVSGHKVYGPKGVGALLTRRRNGKRPPLTARSFGGGQERGLRPGTQPVPLIAGLGLAAELAMREGPARRAATAAIRSQALAALTPLNPTIHGDPMRGVLPNILSVSFPGLDSEAAMLALKDVAAVSNGSACTSASYTPSHVLIAMGLPDEIVQGTVRFSWSHRDVDLPWSRIAEAISLFL